MNTQPLERKSPRIPKDGGQKHATDEVAAACGGRFVERLLLIGAVLCLAVGVAVLAAMRAGG